MVVCGPINMSATFADVVEWYTSTILVLVMNFRLAKILVQPMLRAFDWEQQFSSVDLPHYVGTPALRVTSSLLPSLYRFVVAEEPSVVPTRKPLRLALSLWQERLSDLLAPQEGECSPDR